MRVWLPLMENVLIPLTRNILLPLRVADPAIQKKMYGTCLSILIISKKEIKGIKNS